MNENAQAIPRITKARVASRTDYFCGTSMTSEILSREDFTMLQQAVPFFVVARLDLFVLKITEGPSVFVHRCLRGIARVW